jgi:hypothetical protein
MCALTDDKAAVVIDHELDEEKGLDPLRPSHPMPALRLVAPEGQPLVLHLRS